MFIMGVSNNGFSYNNITEQRELSLTSTNETIDCTLKLKFKISLYRSNKSP